MNILSLSFANLLRNKARFFLTIISIAASTAVLFSILSFHRGFDREISKELSKTGVHFMIVPSGCPHEVASLILHGAVIPKFLPPDILNKIIDSEHIALASPILVFQSPNHKRGKMDIIYGVNMQSLKTLKPHWKITGNLPQNHNEILLGYEIASHDKLKQGDHYYIGSQQRPLTISGIIEKTSSQDDAFVYTSLEKAQEILNKENAYTAVAIQVKNPEKLYEITEVISSEIPGIQIVTISQIMNSLASVANSAKVLSLSIAIIAMIISAVGVMNTILMSAFERKQETGMMRAIGASRSHIFAMYSIESLIQTSLGGFVGIVSAMFSSRGIEYLAKKMMPYSPSGQMILFEYDIAGMCILLSVLIGLIVGFYPAWLASRVSPIEAIKT